jgi:hypothetical protein
VSLSLFASAALFTILFSLAPKSLSGGCGEDLSSLSLCFAVVCTVEQKKVEYIMENDLRRLLTPSLKGILNWKLFFWGLALLVVQ